MLDPLKANWKAPAHVTALSTKRQGGVSAAPYDSNNLGDHVGDSAAAVAINRLQLAQHLSLPAEPIWLKQTHSTVCIRVEAEVSRQADAAVTSKPDTVLAILTADCLPITLCNRAGNEIAAIHAGWRGLVNGIIKSTLDGMHSEPSDLIAWIGPAICQRCYETGEEVRQNFVNNFPFAARAFTVNDQRLYANLPQLAELVLLHHGLKSIYHSSECTYESNTNYFSYRRAPQTGRIATLIWFNRLGSAP